MNQNTKTTKLVLTALLSAIAAVLMFFEFPLTFIAPNFYEFDFSELPVLIGTFMINPVAGIVIEAVKILLKLIIKGTSTGFVGELANFAIGCALVVVAGIIYRIKKTKSGAIMGMLCGTVSMTIVAVFFNCFVLIPLYSAFMPMEQIIQLGKDIIPFVNDTFTFCLFCVAPFNIVKGIIISVITFIVYKPLERLIHKINSAFKKDAVKNC